MNSTESSEINGNEQYTCRSTKGSHCMLMITYSYVPLLLLPAMFHFDIHVKPQLRKLLDGIMVVDVDVVFEKSQILVKEAVENRFGRVISR